MTMDPKLLSDFHRSGQPIGADAEGFNRARVLFVHDISSLEKIQSKSPKISTNFEEKDIELVMSQTSASRENAISALEESDGDIVNAILSLVKEE